MFVFSLLNSKSSLHILDTRPLSYIWFRIFSTILQVIFSLFLMMSFNAQFLIFFMESNYSVTSVLIVNSFQNSWRVRKPTNTEQWSISSCGVALIHTSSSNHRKSWASAKCGNIFSLSKCNEYRVWQVLKPTSTKVWL